MADCKSSPLAKRSKIAPSEGENSNQDESEDTRPLCRYGARCFRRSMQHKQEFRHPENIKNGASHETTQHNSKTSESNASDLPECSAGLECEETSLIHFAEYSHPVTVIKTDNGEGESSVTGENECVTEQNECDECDVTDGDFPECEPTLAIDEDYGLDDDTGLDDENKLAASKISRDDTVMSRGPSILRCYSILTEDERKELIRRAFELKDMLKKDLNETIKVIEKKNQELRKIHSQLEKAQLKIEGEEEALRKDDLVYFSLYAEREYRADSAAQIHFRLAESQFYRLVDVKDKYRVTKVDYVVNPVLIRRFKKAQARLKHARGDTSCYPVLAFHGTKEDNIHCICQSGFRVPGESNFEHATDTGWYGRGVYFSEFPSYSMEYIKGSSKLLLCQVLPGKVYRCTQLIHGQPLQEGHDSHTSPDGKELVAFNSHHILPAYIVHYSMAQGDFTYTSLNQS